ncbi:MAG: flagellin [Candidatus Sericytochromatia bacterium]|nr:flagellin [Candidatus Sericytochromatia bacterium]
MRINNNMSAMTIWRQGLSINRDLDRSLERLSSGSRINRASDGAADLAISERLRGRISSITQGERNLQTAYAQGNIQDSALQEFMGLAQRVVEIASAYSSADTNTQAVLAAEASEISTVVTNTIASLRYNDVAVPATTSVNVDGTTSVSFTLADFANIDFTSADVTAATAVADAQVLVDAIATELATLGGAMAGMEANMAVLAGRREAHVMGESAIRDTDIAAESTRLTRAQILSQSNVAMLAQANARPMNLLALLR